MWSIMAKSTSTVINAYLIIVCREGHSVNKLNKENYENSFTIEWYSRLKESTESND